MGRVSLSGLLVLIAVVQPAAQVRLADASDRTAFQQWFVYLADAQYYRTTSDVLDCAGLVRHAAREALRAHTPEWLRTATLPVVRTFPDVRDRPPVVGGSIALFRDLRRITTEARRVRGRANDCPTQRACSRP